MVSRRRPEGVRALQGLTARLHAMKSPSQRCAELTGAWQIMRARRGAPTRLFRPERSAGVKRKPRPALGTDQASEPETRRQGGMATVRLLMTDRDRRRRAVRSFHSFLASPARLSDGSRSPIKTQSPSKLITTSRLRSADFRHARPAPMRYSRDLKTPC